jgi:hypothetical protein
LRVFGTFSLDNWNSSSGLGLFPPEGAEAKKLAAFLDPNFSDSMDRMFAKPAPKLRVELLALNSIAQKQRTRFCSMPGVTRFFVADAYARRVLDPIASAKYDEIRTLVEHALCKEDCQGGLGPALNPHRQVVRLSSPMSTASRTGLAQVYREMHGLLVQVGKLSIVARCNQTAGSSPLVPC